MNATGILSGRRIKSQHELSVFFLPKKGEEKTNEVKEIFDKAYLQIIARLDERDIDAIVKGMTNINNNLKKIS
ncbi:hypothetical protein [Limosilactobacillus reuteri]|uniref:hypothetical protein n=1 Tax=Limosilactobacillus reuteri TaxID=1598 RepID=UPI00273E1B2F|nr:hypothetical protein [Limosilactobacillus reuteri]WLR78741.1 hypothetical protein Q3A95_05690 [Limosilactobacillus reuteri]